MRSDYFYNCAKCAKLERHRIMVAKKEKYRCRGTNKVHTHTISKEFS